MRAMGENKPRTLQLPTGYCRFYGYVRLHIRVMFVLPNCALLVGERVQELASCDYTSLSMRTAEGATFLFSRGDQDQFVLIYLLGVLEGLKQLLQGSRYGRRGSG